MATIPCQNTEMIADLGVRSEECERSVVTIGPNGTRYQEAEAIMVATGVALNLPFLLEIGKVPVLKRVADRAYRWIARNRHRFPGKPTPLNGK